MYSDHPGVTRPAPGVLVFSSSKWKAAVGALVWTLVAAGSFAALFAGVPLSRPASGWWIVSYLLYLLPLISLIEAYRNVKLFREGKTIIFREDAGTVTRNDRLLASFPEIDRVEIRTNASGDGQVSYDLFLVMTDGRRADLTESGDLERVSDLADEIGTMAKVPVTGKPRGAGFSLLKEILEGDGGLTPAERRLKLSLEQRLRRPLSDLELRSIKTQLEAEESTNPPSTPEGG